tara:strand:+ start:2531 stop:2671 length:141 start_codon:yes stop_codon:yes gene_type:complete
MSRGSSEYPEGHTCGGEVGGDGGGGGDDGGDGGRSHQQSGLWFPLP